MRLRIAVVLLVTLVFLGVALAPLELDVAREALGTADWTRVAGALGLYVVAHMLRAGRLGLLVGGDVPFKRLFIINTVGFLAINVVPLRLGEAVRPWLLAEREGIALGRGIAGIVLERLLDMLMLLCMLLGLTLIVQLPPGGVQVEGIDVVRGGQVFAGTLVAAGTVFAGFVVFAGDRVLPVIARLPLGTRMASLGARFREGILALIRKPARGVMGVLLSAVIWAVTVGAVWLTLSAFPGLPATLAAAWTTWSVTISGMAAVPTAGFFGIYEVCCAAALALWRVDPSIARTFAVVLHLGQFGFIVVLGGGALLAEGLGLRDLVQRPPPSLG
ncbi:MAG: lysylphosphatidylglycerol synthase transmembrane domain-containing protein [Myxococcota bacterium]|nr:lysylphosphatidylglycerol synthase transmembrane domain-containing protein [Myxococcota bacterium]MEC8424560.1 lysylphosphatidylglycerol synthase transmembrane domain-containing protein [Myxococcota bacterium]